MKLTRAQRNYLANADICTPPDEHAVRHEMSGIIARGPALRSVARLESLGLVEYIGHGPHIDETRDKEWPIYGITAAGRAALTKGSAR